MPQGSVRASVIVPFRDNRRDLPGLLSGLVGQEADGGWEVVAVDNRSRDGSRAVVEGFRGRLPLRVVDAAARANPAYARNVGARESRGDVLLFIDADDQVAEGYVRVMADAAVRHRFVTSRVDSETLNPPWVRHAHGPPWQAEGLVTFLNFLPGTGSNIGVERSLFARVGGFPESFHGSEDLALSWLLQIECGVAPVFVGEAVYRYRFRRSHAGLFRQSANWGRDHALLYRCFREHGLPARPLRDALAEWRHVLGGLLTAQSADRPALIVRFGYCVGRLHGSARYRSWYL